MSTTLGAPSASRAARSRPYGPTARTAAARRESLRREGRLLQRLTHPHIVRAYETVEASAPLVVLETLPGATLSVLIADEPVPAPEELGHLGLQLASALAYLHAMVICIST